MTPVIPSDRSRGSRPLDLFESTVLLLSIGALGAAILLPAAAEALLRLYLPALALAFVLNRAHDARLPRRMEQDHYSPFLHFRDAEGADEVPRVILERARGLAALDGGTAASPVPVAVRWLVIDAFTRRLAEHRGLHLADPSHHEAIRRLLSERAWSFVRPAGVDAAEHPAGAEGARRTPASLDHLDSILDDLEKL